MPKNINYYYHFGRPKKWRKVQQKNLNIHESDYTNNYFYLP